MQKKRRDPFIHMKKVDRPLFMRSFLALAGNYGWFGLVAGYTPSPNVLFAETNCDGLFPSHSVCRYRRRAVGATPLRNRSIDLRFYGMELAETPGYTSCFRIRPASLYNSNNVISHNDGVNMKNAGRGNVVNGIKNPFYTRLGKPLWYAADSLKNIFGIVELKNHVSTFDNTIEKFALLVEGDVRWQANLQDKLSVLDKCIVALSFESNQLAETLKKENGNEVAIRSLKDVHDTRGDNARFISSSAKRRHLCNAAETAITEATQLLFSRESKRKKSENCDGRESKRNLEKRFRNFLDALSICYMLRDECSKNPDRFIDGECRVAVRELYKQLYRVSARQHIKNALVRGMKLSVIWRRPVDKTAEETLANVPRCRIPQIVVQIEKLTGGELLPSLQILNTRDVNPVPIRHTLLRLVCGNVAAEDISVMNCLEWMNWCCKTRGTESLKDVATSILCAKTRHHNCFSSRFAKKVKRENGKDSKNQNCVNCTVTYI